MIQTMNRVLKSDEVELDGRCHLDIGASVSQHNRNAAAAGPKVKLVDNNNEYALIEFVCACGKKTIVRCEYNNVSAPKTVVPNAVNNQKKP